MDNEDYIYRYTIDRQIDVQIDRYTRKKFVPSNTLTTL